MNRKEAFHFGFLARCVEEGLSPAETQGRIKAAHILCDMTEKQAGGTAHAIGGVGGGTLGSAYGPMGAIIGSVFGAHPVKASLGGLGLAALTGAGGGYLTGKASQPELEPPEERKERELAEAYRRYARAAERETARRTKRQQRPKSAPRQPSLI